MPNDPTTLDAVLIASELPTPQVLATLTMLEMKRLVRRLPGGLVVRVTYAVSMRVSGEGEAPAEPAGATTAANAAFRFGRSLTLPQDAVQPIQNRSNVTVLPNAARSPGQGAPQGCA